MTAPSESLQTLSPDRRAGLPRSTEHRTRLLYVNVAIGLIAIILSHTVFDRDATSLLAQLTHSVLIGLAQAPLMLACVVAAWGPWTPPRRATLLLTAAAVVTIWTLAAQGPSAYRGRGDPWILIGQTFLDLGSIVFCATLVLTFIASLFRWRLGPAEMEPVRMTILGMMFATAITGVIFAFKGQIDYTIAWFRSVDKDVVSLSAHQYRAMMQMVVGGWTTAIFIGLSAASRTSILARVCLVMLIVGIVPLHLLLRDEPSLSLPYVMTPAAGLAGLLTAAAWIAINLYVLERTGWGLARRECRKEKETGQP